MIRFLDAQKELVQEVDKTEQFAYCLLNSAHTRKMFVVSSLKYARISTPLEGADFYAKSSSF